MEREAVEVCPDKATYEAGEVAQVLVQSPFAPAEGMVMLKSEGVVWKQRFRMDESATVVEGAPRLGAVLI